MTRTNREMVQIFFSPYSSSCSLVFWLSDFCFLFMYWGVKNFVPNFFSPFPNSIHGFLSVIFSVFWAQITRVPTVLNFHHRPFFTLASISICIEVQILSQLHHLVVWFFPHFPSSSGSFRSDCSAWPFSGRRFWDLKLHTG
ncbi:hypothetical protein I3760_06G102800 [Carya illinoinensis]|nr:hypothetical protein I3760_06G102800 [Carya illinoinensis]